MLTLACLAGELLPAAATGPQIVGRSTLEPMPRCPKPRQRPEADEAAGVQRQLSVAGRWAGGRRWLRTCMRRASASVMHRGLHPPGDWDGAFQNESLQLVWTLKTRRQRRQRCRVVFLSRDVRSDGSAVVSSFFRATSDGRSFPSARDDFFYHGSQHGVPWIHHGQSCGAQFARVQEGVPFRIEFASDVYCGVWGSEHWICKVLDGPYAERCVLVSGNEMLALLGANQCAKARDKWFRCKEHPPGSGGAQVV